MLQVRRLEKVIEQRTVLALDELDVGPGEVVTVVGPVGSGKTLLIRLLSGTLIPSSGSILVEGQDIHQTPAVRRRIGVLFEEDLLYKRHTALGNLEFQCRVRGLPTGEAGRVVALAGLSDQLKERVSDLSRTAQRRVAFARALLGQPAVLLLDQPILRTDLDTQALFARLIGQAAEAGVAVLLTDEDLAWAGKCSTRVVELENGHVASSYAPRAESGHGPAVPELFIPFKVPARKDDRIVLYDPGEILFATSRDGRTFLRTVREEATTNLTLQELEGRLTGRGFFKAHRAYLVNLQHIKTCSPQYLTFHYALEMAG
jgi:ABC-2 type transport system ATP-binding protein